METTFKPDLDDRIIQLSKENIEGVIDVFLEEQKSKMGRKWLKKYFMWFADHSNCVALVAEQGNKVVGYCIFAPLRYNQQLYRDIALTTIRTYVTRPWILLNKNMIQRIQHVILSRVHPNRTPYGSLDTYKIDELPQPIMLALRMYVSIQARNRGFGFQLVRTSIEQAQHMNVYKTIVGWILENNVASNRIFQKLGFHIDGRDGAYNIVCKAIE